MRAQLGSGTAFIATATQTWTSADLNVWKHVAMTYDGTTVRLYVDGVLASSATGTHGTNNNPLVFGQWSLGTEYWNGLIDEVRVYTRALTATEVQTDLNTPVGGGPSNQAPTATLTAPANGATFTEPASVTLSATASDADGTIARVEFYNGSTLLGSDTTAPYSFTWSSVSAGTYALKATAVDNAGATGSSAVATITVSAATTPPTKVVFQASSDHSTTLVTSYLFEVFASGADPNTATPVASSDLGKPTPDANGDITVDRATFFSALAPGSYVATVSAIGPGGKGRGTAVTFTR
jgi:hypothetical protein